MKNLKIKKAFYRIIAIGLTSFVLITTGCSSKTNEKETKTTTETTTSIENNNDNETTNEEFDCFETETNSIIYTENFELVDEIWGDYFIDAVDFIFYGKEYKDTKFADLNPEAQQKCIEEIKKARDEIAELNPNWEEDLKETKGSIVETYYNLLDNIENLIGTENYENIGNTIEDINEGLNNIGNSIKDNASDWYQGYKNNRK